jgi:hypothetical protein
MKPLYNSEQAGWQQEHKWYTLHIWRIVTLTVAMVRFILGFCEPAERR